MSAVEYTEQDLERAHVVRSLTKAHGTADQAAEEVAQRHGVRLREMLGPSRETHLVRARLDLYRILRAEPFRWSLPSIGRFVNRDHTSILYALMSDDKKARKRMRATGS
jgi:chromosomal replication initiation ATPase DnaA